MKEGTSHPQSAPGSAALSLGISPRRIHSGQLGLDFEIGDCNLDAVVRAEMSRSIRGCNLSREQIADRMAELLATRVTSKMLDSYSASSMQPNRLPAAWIFAFCKATGDDSLLHAIAKAAGCRLIGKEEETLLELGRQYLRGKRAAEEAEHLEKRLSGVEL